MPRIARMMNERNIKADTTTDFSKMGPVERAQRMLSRYDPTSELIMDYIELYVQWGYLTLFGASCPLVVIFAFITNLVETRTDGTKLFHDYRRVLPNRVDGIGEPLSIFYFTLYCAVPINCALIVFPFNAVAFVDPNFQIFVLLFVLLFMVAFLMQLDALFPDVSRKTAIQVARQEEFHKRVILGEDPEEGDLDFVLSDDMVGSSIEKARAQATGRMNEGGKVVDPATYAEMVITTTGASNPGAGASNPILGGTGV